jgi:galactokinase
MPVIVSDVCSPKRRRAAMTDFELAFGRPAEVERFAPGRVNLIGEHTDYSGGFVMPLAIPQTTKIALATRSQRIVRIASAAMHETMMFELGGEKRNGGWIDYVQGTVVALRARGYDIGGFDAAVTSDVPIGSGLSSSAALEVALLRALRDAFGLAIDDVAIAEVGRAAETEFVGVPIGIMDQMAASLGDAKAALFLDTRSLAFERVPLPEELEVVVIDSGVTHENASNDYVIRRDECERAARLLDVHMLRDVVDQAQTASLPEPLARRARHVVTENARVLEALAFMREGKIVELGELLARSHASLRDDFEVSVPAVDRLVEIAQADRDVLGARMTGGGFGGAIVVLARRGTGGAAAERIVNAYGPDGRVLVPTE